MFTPVPIDPSSLALGEQVIHLFQGAWQVLDITSRRRGMTLAKGVAVVIPQSKVELVWLEKDRPLLFRLTKPELLDIRPPTQPRPPLQNTPPRVAIAPQYQAIEGAPHPRSTREVALTDRQGPAMSLLSSDVIAFLAQTPLSTGFNFCYKSHPQY